MRSGRAPSVTTIFLQVVVVLVGIGALALLLWEPHIEGRNARATTFQIYVDDPFLLYAYGASLAFFLALYQAFTVLRYARHDRLFSPEAVRALRIIRYCASTLIVLIGGAAAYLVVFVRGKDDIAGGIAMSLLMIFASVVVATAAALCERLLQSGVELKSENDLTV